MNLFRKDLDTQDQPSDLGVAQKANMMCLNESTLDPFETIGDKVVEKLKSVPLNRYFNPVTKQLRESLAEYVGQGITPRQLLFGNGADEMLYATFVAVRNEPGDFAVSFAPSYFDYKTYANAVGLELKTVLLNPGFDFSVNDYLKALDHPQCKLAILCNPNNPTGNLFDESMLHEIIRNCRCPVLLDETYYEFSKKTFLSYIEKYSNLLIVRSFSKAFSAAGLRFGYIISNEENISRLKKVMTIFHSSMMIKSFAYTILQNRKVFLDHVEEVLRLKEELYDGMRGIEGITVHPSATNFLLFTNGEKTSALFEYLLKNEVAVRNVGGLPLLKNHLRVTIGTSAQNRLFLKLLRDFNS